MYLDGLTFLVVDDSPFMRQMLREILHHFGVRSIREASDGAEALQVMLAWSPDIVLMDWEMAPFNGIDFTRSVRASTRKVECFTPIIMISGHSEYWRIQQARNAGVNEYLVKPVSPKALFSRIRAVIERPRPYVRLDSYFGPDRRRQDINQAKDRRASQKHTPVPADQSMHQDQVNALFNPGSEHPDEQSTPSPSGRVLKNPPH